jgi:TonB family protein
MTRQFTHVLAFGFCMVATPSSFFAQGGSSASLNTAVDVKGVRHTSREYRDHRAPWNFADCIKAVGPEYPSADRARYHQGIGLFRVTIDPKSGTVAHVTVRRSTGYASLDSSAVAALRRWRWKPGTWKEVDITITFQMAAGPPKRLPSGAVSPSAFIVRDLI